MNTTAQRISDKLIKDLKKTGIKMMNQGLINPYKKTEMSMRALTEGIVKTPSWKKAQEELLNQMRISKRKC